MVGFSKRSPQIPHGVPHVGGEDEGEGGYEGEGRGGWGESCWRTPLLGDFVSCHWAPVESKAKQRRSTSISFLL